MHFSVLLFHSSSVDNMMDKRNYDAGEEDGANIVFNEDYTVEQAEKEYKAYIKKNPKEKTRYSNVSDFMDSYHGCILDDDGEFYGSYSNADGMYDWYEVGGRWSNLLPEFVGEKNYKKALKEALDLNNEEVKEKYRDNVEEYVKLKEMPLQEACQKLDIGICNSIEISDKIPAEEIIKFWMNVHKKEGNSIKRENAMITDYFILEDGPNGEEVIHGVDVDMFVDTYNYFVKINKKQNPMDKFYLTILDLHT
jgi:hypothetical protein